MDHLVSIVSRWNNKSGRTKSQNSDIKLVSVERVTPTKPSTENTMKNHKMKGLLNTHKVDTIRKYNRTESAAEITRLWFVSKKDPDKLQVLLHSIKSEVTIVLQY